MEQPNRKTIIRSVPLSRAEMEQREATKADLKLARLLAGSHLFAEIRGDSKYFGQGEAGLKFSVYIETGPFPVQGGPGGQYRLEDVLLYACTPDGDMVGLS